MVFAISVLLTPGSETGAGRACRLIPGVCVNVSTQSDIWRIHNDTSSRGASSTSPLSSLRGFAQQNPCFFAPRRCATNTLLFLPPAPESDSDARAACSQNLNI
jgi:hypothetical protein